MTAGTDTGLLILFSFQWANIFFLLSVSLEEKKKSLIHFLDIVPGIPQL